MRETCAERVLIEDYSAIGDLVLNLIDRAAIQGAFNKIRVPRTVK